MTLVSVVAEVVVFAVGILFSKIFRMGKPEFIIRPSPEKLFNLAQSPFSCSKLIPTQAPRVKIIITVAIIIKNEKVLFLQQHLSELQQPDGQELTFKSLTTSFLTTFFFVFSIFLYIKISHELVILI